MGNNLRLQSWVFDTTLYDSRILTQLFSYMAALHELWEMSDDGDFSWRQIKSYKTHNVSLLQSDLVFELSFFFLRFLIPFRVKKSCPTSMPFLLTYIDVRAVQISPPS